MKKTILVTSITTFAIFSSVLISCQKNEQQITATEGKDSTKKLKSGTTICKECDDQTNEALHRVNISKVEGIDINNYSNGGLIPFLTNNQIDVRSYNLSNAKLLTTEFSNSEGILLLQNSNDQSGYLVIRIENIATNERTLMGFRTFNVKIDGGRITGVDFSSINNRLGGTTRLDLKPPTEAKGNPDLLGPRRKGESYEDCVARNWDNFATDLPSYVAQTLNGPLVLAAIGIDCLFETTDKKAKK